MKKADTKLHTEKTSAADKSIGFEFQFYYFLYRLLILNQGESVGLEVLDDVSATLDNNRQILAQLKHTTQTTHDGSPKALSTLDSDLWKTISNWIKTIIDPNAARGTKTEQLTFVQKTDFVLVSNKADNKNNKFLNMVKQLTTATIDEHAFHSFLLGLQSKASDLKIENYIQDLINLDSEVRQLFLRNLAFELDTNDIIAKCKSAIKEKMVDDDRLDEIFHKLDSQLRQDNYKTVRDKKKIEITFDEFHRKYRRYFELARSSSLQIEELGSDAFLQTAPENQRFIRQLVAVNDIDQSDISTILDYTRMLLKARTNLDNWLKAGLVTQEEADALHTQAKLKWKTEFNYHHKDISSEKAIESNCREMLYELRKNEIKWTRGALDLEISHGEFYHLSDIPEIGWHPDWSAKFQ